MRAASRHPSMSFAIQVRTTFRVGDPEIVLPRHGEDEDRFDLGTSAQLHLGDAGLRLDPAEHFLDPLAADLARPVARMSGGAAIERGSADKFRGVLS